MSEAAATRLGLEGIPILRALPGSSAARAGVRGVDLRTGILGDVIVAVNGKPVRRLLDLSDQLDDIGVGHTARVSLLRGNRTITLDIPVEDVGEGR